MKDYDDLLKKFREEFAKEFLARVKDRTPFVTGVLQEGWDKDITDSAVEIYNNVEYAPFVEYGTYKMAPVGMLRTTALEAQEIAELAKERAGL
jgi:hypothetical protein